MADSGADIIRKALNDFKASIDTNDAKDFDKSTVQDVWDTARNIERQQVERAQLQNMRRIEPFLQSLEGYASVMDTFCQGFSPMAWVWVRKSQ